ncbi:MAG: alanine-zipper protein [Gammaproteobacteria bacterium]|nr:alanine-zipper protein [Gammaproteobacteria bacterium]MDQ7076160.1 alanine-zipper protein [Gammaproteobacteria bacterium]
MKAVTRSMSIAAAVVLTLGLSACGSDGDSLSGLQDEMATVSKTANDAASNAEVARREADEAKRLAKDAWTNSEDAKTMASEAQATANDANARVNSAFKGSMMK